MKTPLLFIVLLLALISCHSGRKAVVEWNETEIREQRNDSLTVAGFRKIKEVTLSGENVVIDSPVIFIKRPDSATIIVKARKIQLNNEQARETIGRDSISIKSIGSMVKHKSENEERREIKTAGTPGRFILAFMFVALIAGMVLKYLRR